MITKLTITGGRIEVRTALIALLEIATNTGVKISVDQPLTEDSPVSTAADQQIRTAAAKTGGWRVR